MVAGGAKGAPPGGAARRWRKCGRMAGWRIASRSRRAEVPLRKMRMSPAVAAPQRSGEIHAGTDVA